jgi:hypothetical protein
LFLVERKKKRKEGRRKGGRKGREGGRKGRKRRREAKEGREGRKGGRKEGRKEGIPFVHRRGSGQMGRREENARGKTNSHTDGRSRTTQFTTLLCKLIILPPR